MLRSYRSLQTFDYWWDQPGWCEQEYSDDEEDIGRELGPIIIEGLSSSKPSLASLKVNGLGAIRVDIRSDLLWGSETFKKFMLLLSYY